MSSRKLFKSHPLLVGVAQCILFSALVGWVVYELSSIGEFLGQERCAHHWEFSGYEWRYEHFTCFVKTDDKHWVPEKYFTPERR